MTYQRKQEYEFDAKDTFVVRKPFKSNGRNYVSGNPFNKDCVSERRLRQMVVSGHLVPEDRVVDAPAAPVVIVDPVVDPVVEVEVVVEPEVVVEDAPVVDEVAAPVVETETVVDASPEVAPVVEEAVKRGPGRPKVK